MSKFKVGDLVIGNEKNYYCITGQNTVCEVVRIYGERMEVKVKKELLPILTPYKKDSKFNVNTKYFKEYKKDNKSIDEEIKELERRLKRLKKKAESLNYDGSILSGKIHIKNKISVDTNEKLLNTIEYLDYSEINISTEKILNEVNVKLESKNDKIKVEGTAKTHPDDIFDVKIGTELAYYRALEKFYSEKVKRIVKKLY